MRLKWSAAAALGAAIILTTGLGSSRVALGNEVAHKEVLTIVEVMDLITSEFNGKVDTKDLVNGAINGMLQSLDDPYSYYLDPEELRSFNEEMHGYFGGIGVMVEAQGGSIVIMSVLPGTPAERAGLQPGDRLLAVDGKSIEGAPVEEAVHLIRGEPETELTIKVWRQANGMVEDVRLKRAVIDVPAIDTRYMDNNIGYIKLTQFNSNVAEQFKFIYDRFVQIGARGIIVDLRNNPGGYLDQAVEIAQTLIPNGTIMHIENNRGGKMTIDVRPHKPGPPLVILVNGGSASASEIVAAAVKENRAGTIIGERTYGKGSVQTVMGLQNGGAVRITTARYLTPGGTWLDGKGLEPDIVVGEGADDLPPEFTDLGERNLRVGMVGLDVLGLQQRLSFLGYKPGAEDGVLGQKTAAAVRAFQRSRGIREAGGVLFGSKSREALDQAIQEEIKERAHPSHDLPLARAVEVIMNAGKGN